MKAIAAGSSPDLKLPIAGGHEEEGGCVARVHSWLLGVEDEVTAGEGF